MKALVYLFLFSAVALNFQPVFSETADEFELLSIIKPSFEHDPEGTVLSSNLQSIAETLGTTDLAPLEDYYRIHNPQSEIENATRYEFWYHKVLAQGSVWREIRFGKLNFYIRDGDQLKRPFEITGNLIEFSEPTRPDGD